MFGMPSHVDWSRMLRLTEHTPEFQEYLRCVDNYLDEASATPDPDESGRGFSSRIGEAHEELEKSIKKMMDLYEGDKK